MNFTWTVSSPLQTYFMTCMTVMTVRQNCKRMPGSLEKKTLKLKQGDMC